ncbi:solute carrier family 35 member F5 isoform X3 [Octopus bimaculoides]|uniref:solute carrier family 35 member F5 isoform X3 n=1 Tax=Octopus bimaculoides TaxID=37653 RepID=UPI00071DADF5|nr:solute carrier family 35 member F5 isoform X3 [Octopus bimaculoides]|eukprot:XP_014790994.1 PREDICTED: solute carrier family 35 member F5-like isoform X3 [Octopus bimaculoides]
MRIYFIHDTILCCYYAVQHAPFKPAMLRLSGLSKPQRLILGVVVLLVVNILWVASSEFTQYIFKQEHYIKPFFIAYAKSAMFMVYLLGFLVLKPWRQQCSRTSKTLPRFEPVEEHPIEVDKLLGDSVFVPLKSDDKCNSTESDDLSDRENTTIVRFNNLLEIRQLSDIYAEESVIARLSYNASIRAEEAKLRALSKLSLKQLAKVAIIYCILYFVGNFCYQKGLYENETNIVNVMSSATCLFTLIGSTIFPSNSADRFSLSKLTAVTFGMCGVVFVSLSDTKIKNGIPASAVWTIASAVFTAIYLVVLKKKADHEDKLDLPMFLGFVGFFSTTLLWPGFFIFHYSKLELFEWPSDKQWMFLAISGMVGTALTEILWIWGCYLTSSLMGTLATSLLIPFSMIADMILKGVSYTWMFYVGSIPVFLSFFALTLLTYYENWDPVMTAIKKILHCICRHRQLIPRLLMFKQVNSLNSFECENWTENRLKV